MMIKMNDITKKYGDAVILEHCSYTFPEKGIVCLMGASGGGKTTLLNLLAGFDTDYSGEIVVGKTPIHHLDADALCNYRRDNIGFVFQNYHLLPGYTVLENVLLACELCADTPECSLDKAKALLAQLGLAEKETQGIETLSGGQKQRVAIARALVRDPQILFADEPTGALDRATSTEMMQLLQGIAKDRLVVVITHDPKICEFADEIIHIRDKTIVAEVSAQHPSSEGKPLVTSTAKKTSAISHAKKNFKVHMKRYIAVSLAISIGILAFLFSLSFSNVTEQSIEDFKVKNTAFNNGYIKGTDDGTIRSYLEKDDRIEHVYYQYKLEGICLSHSGKSQVLDEKFPAPKATEGLSYGVMPRRGEGEIALSPSLAKKFSDNIQSLLGSGLELEVNGQKHSLTISGIYNAGYDDFFVSADIEQQIYKTLTQQSNYSISYDVKEFSEIVAVTNSLRLRGISTVNASDEVYAFQNTFNSLTKLFLVISVLILGIGLFICAILLIKLQGTRYHELGLLSALGFNKRQITAMIRAENLLLAALATSVNLALLGGSTVVCKLFGFPLTINAVQLLLSVAATFVAVLLLSGIASCRLVRTEPAVALRK